MTFVPVIIPMYSSNKSRKPLSKRQLKARAVGQKVGRVVGIIAGIIVAIAMIVLFCS